MGSPRKNGSSERLLRIFLEGIEEKSTIQKTIYISDLQISGCQGCRFCEKNGFCRIRDDMDKMYPLLREADLIVISTPVFFYSFPSQLKALIDRTQALWARRYSLQLIDPKRRMRHGFVLAAGATKGKNLFSGIELTSKYFFDAVGAKFDGLLGVRNVEKPDDLDAFPEFVEELKKKAKEYNQMLTKRKKILFLCRENACRSQMAEAFLQEYVGEEFDVLSAGDNPAKEVNPKAIEVMQELNLDLMYRRPKNLNELLGLTPFDLVITMGCEAYCPSVYAKRIDEWRIEDPSGKSLQEFREVRDIIHEKIKKLLEVLK